MRTFLNDTGSYWPLARRFWHSAGVKASSACPMAAFLCAHLSITGELRHVGYS
jgi:hypothetical protein